MTGQNIQTEPLTEGAIADLEARGIDPELADRYGVLSIVTKRATKSPILLFPHMVGGARVHWAARTLDQSRRFYQQEGGQRCLWNQDIILDVSLRSQAALIITEGHLDALSFMEAGLSAVTSVPDGAPPARINGGTNGNGNGHGAGDNVVDINERRASKEIGATIKYAYLAAIRNEIREWKSVILATDADAGGDRLADDLARIIGRSRCRRAEYPEGCKDANEVLMRFGPEALVALVERAKWVQVGGIYQIDNLPKISLQTAVRAGVSGVDDLWRFRTGEISVLAGVPNHGKTCLANQLGISLAMNRGWSVAWFSPEQHPSIQLERMKACYLDQDLRFASEANLKRAEEFIRSHVVWIAPEVDEDSSVEWLLERMAIVAWRFNCRMVIADTWNQIVHDRGVEWREDEYEREMLKRFRRTLSDCSMHGMILVHPRKPQTDNKDGKPPVPSGYSISGSSHWVNSPDLGATIYRMPDNRSIFRCWKARYADGRDYDNGTLGERTLGFNTNTQRFHAIDTTRDTDARAFKD